MGDGISNKDGNSGDDYCVNANKKYLMYDR